MLREQVDRHQVRRAWNVATWLALVVVLALGAAAVMIGAEPGPSRPGALLERVPVLLAPSGTDGLAGGTDPAAEPASFAVFASQALDVYWRGAFRAMGRPYRSPSLVLIDHGIQVPCFPLLAFEDGAPFYCFLNDTIYLPVPYVSDLARVSGSMGRAAVGYVVAHEYAHHAQHLTGLGDVVEQQAAPTGAPARQASVGYELQADCLAGVWASTQEPPGSLDPAAMARAQDSAALIRDPSEASVRSHGSLPERHSAFWKGYTTGRASVCT